MGGRWRDKRLVSVKIYELYSADIKFMDTRWRYKFLVSLNITNCAMRTYQNSWVDVGVTNLQCLHTLQTVQCKHVRIHGWTLALQTSSDSSVLYDLYNADMSTIMGGRWRYKLLVSLNFTNCTMQTYQKSWADVGVTNF